MRISAIISQVEKDPLHRDRLKRWLVRCKIIEVIQGELPGGIAEILLLIHSPSKTFADVDIIDKKYQLTFLSEFNQPYTGKLAIQPITE